MKSKYVRVLFSAPIFFLVLACGLNLARKDSCHEEMIKLLRHTKVRLSGPENAFDSHAKLPYMDSLLNLAHSTSSERRYCSYLKANILLELGREVEAIDILSRLVEDEVPYEPPRILRSLAIAYLRLGERSNCIVHHASESCILPISGLGIHQDRNGSERAIEIFTQLLEIDSADLESLWLLNLAHMTLGDYPDGVPAKYLIPGMEGDTTVKVKPFEDAASDLKIDVNNMAGGCIVDDFDNDGYLDIITSSWDTGEHMHFFRNNGDGTFANLTANSGLMDITGGLNILQADYNNDGYVDVFVLRGAWKGPYGTEPNSLLRNNGDGTFTDVTTISGLLSFHPTQTAVWNDFNNDGWLDLFIGNESSGGAYSLRHPAELYINNHDGTFTDVAGKAQCAIIGFVKGVTSGDYNNDGWQDIFISTSNGKRILLKNEGIINGEVRFKNVTQEAGLDQQYGDTFPTWFWDYNNDGWLDIFTCDYTYEKPLAHYAAAEKLNVPAGNPGKMLLYKNNQDGTFTDVSSDVGLSAFVFAMGSNFGDFDNDGYLDMYLGTGNPQYQSLIPNKMFKNISGKKFADVTASARVGHLQKGHGVSFADVDNDGDQDIYIEMGGAYPGDSYQNSFFLNPGQNANKWLCVALQGSKSNQSAIGTRVKVTFRENGETRSVYRDVNSGGSFGASPLRREIGLGAAEQVDKLEIFWHGSGEVQVFYDIKPNQFIRITEGSSQIEQLNLKVINWILPNRLCLPGTEEFAVQNPFQ